MKLVQSGQGVLRDLPREQQEEPEQSGQGDLQARLWEEPEQSEQGDLQVKLSLDFHL